MTTPPAPVPPDGYSPVTPIIGSSPPGLLFFGRGLSTQWELWTDELTPEAIGNFYFATPTPPPEPAQAGACDAIDQIVAAAFRAKSDPGTFTPRADDYGEALGSWERRAMAIALAPFRRAPSPTPGEGRGETPWDVQYLVEHQLSEDRAKECAAENDGYGRNFHEGRASGMVTMDIMAREHITELRDALRVARVNMERCAKALGCAETFPAVANAVEVVMMQFSTLQDELSAARKEVKTLSEDLFQARHYARSFADNTNKAEASLLEAKGLLQRCVTAFLAHARQLERELIRAVNSILEVSKQLIEAHETIGEHQVAWAKSDEDTAQLRSQLAAAQSALVAERDEVELKSLALKSSRVANDKLAEALATAQRGSLFRPADVDALTAENVALRGAQDEIRVMLESAKNALKDIVSLGNINSFIREVLTRLGNEFNERIKALAAPATDDAQERFLQYRKQCRANTGTGEIKIDRWTLTVSEPVDAAIAAAAAKTAAQGVQS